MHGTLKQTTGWGRDDDLRVVARAYRMRASYLYELGVPEAAQARTALAETYELLARLEAELGHR